jgi:hypothetical protein
MAGLVSFLNGLFNMFSQDLLSALPSRKSNLFLVLGHSINETQRTNEIPYSIFAQIPRPFIVPMLQRQNIIFLCNISLKRFQPFHLPILRGIIFMRPRFALPISLESFCTNKYLFVMVAPSLSIIEIPYQA